MQITKLISFYFCTQLVLIVCWPLMEFGRHRRLCHCPQDGHLDLRFRTFCITNERASINYAEFCDRINNFTVDNLPFTAVEESRFCTNDQMQRNEKMVLVYLEAGQRHGNKVMIGTPLARHKFERRLFVKCEHRSAFETLESNVSLRIWETLGRTTLEYKGNCNSVFNATQLMQLTRAPFTISKLYIENYVDAAFANVSFSKAFILLVNFPMNHSHLKLTFRRQCTIMCELAAEKEALVQSDFKTKFTIKKDNTIVFEQKKRGTSVYRQLKRHYGIGNYTCMVDVLYRSCPPHSYLHESVIAEMQVKSFGNCSGRTVVETFDEEYGRSTVTLMIIVVTVTTMFTLIALMIVLHRKNRKSYRSMLQNPSSIRAPDKKSNSTAKSVIETLMTSLKLSPHAENSQRAKSARGLKDTTKDDENLSVSVIADVKKKDKRKK